MEARHFRRFCEIAYQRAGITLKPGKEALVSARIGKRIRTLGIGGAGDYVRFLEADETGEELVEFLDAISTHYTRFFREPDHFEHLAEALRGWEAAGQKRFRIWCAASSSGEEPYTLAITLAEAFDDRPVDCRILASDISTKVLNRALQGIYGEDGLEPLSRAQRSRYFTRISSRRDPEILYQANPELKSYLVFRRLNLAHPPLPIRGPLDFVFCRNVMIYFDACVRQRLVSEIDRLVRPGGYLVVGHSETLTGIQSSFRVVSPSIYQKPANGG